MSVVTDIKNLVLNSRLFVEADKLKDHKGGKRGRRTKDAAKIGQGGTLDPLADGVLGEHEHPLFRRHVLILIFLNKVIGVGKGTKKLGQFLDCVKVGN